jgi:hypothetical protein
LGLLTFAQRRLQAKANQPALLDGVSFSLVRHDNPFCGWIAAVAIRSSARISEPYQRRDV